MISPQLPKFTKQPELQTDLGAWGGWGDGGYRKSALLRH